jgi:hypothetical protein
MSTNMPPRRCWLVMNLTTRLASLDGLNADSQSQKIVLAYKYDEQDRQKRPMSLR